MRNTYQRTLLLALLVVGALPVVLTTVATLVVVRQPGVGEQQTTVVVVAIAIGIFAGTASLAIVAARVLADPIRALVEGVGLMAGPNPRHRLAAPEDGDLSALAGDINRLADRVGRADAEVEARLASATRELAFERETLASVLFALADGVVVCTPDLRIVLSNAAARRMLSQPARPLRRGESVLAYANEALLRPLIDPLAARPDDLPARRLERGTLSLPSGMIVQVSTMVAAGEQGESHYVFVLRDVSQQVAVDRSRDRFLAETVQRLRSPVTSMLSAAEILRDYGALPDAQREAFLDVLARDAGRLADELDAMQAAVAGGPAPSWAGDDVPIPELVERAAADSAGILGPRDQRLAVRGERVSARGDRLALLQVTRRLLELAAERAPRGAELAIAWRRSTPRLLELAIEIPEADEADHGSIGDHLFELPLDDGPGDPRGTTTIRRVVKEHQGEIWIRLAPGRAALVLTLPSGEEPKAVAANLDRDAVGHQVLALLGEGGFFDPRPPAMGVAGDGDGLLTDLSFVVFDLETTGLHPGGGDEVVSIGAVRIRGGRVIPEDYFMALVDPGRPIPPASTRIHGIADEMVRGKPPLDDVLPGFLDYAAGSALAAHVASFDLAFLNRRLRRLGRPSIAQGAVLDTLLLSSSLFPSWGGYNVEELAGRFGIEVVGRHTSLGDALTTAEILIRLLGVLEQRGITTLRGALELQAGDAIRKAVGAVRAELNWG